MPRSLSGGRHELGQNFLIHKPTVSRIVGLVDATSGPILEIGAGDGALTRPLSRLGRPLTAVEIDEHRAARLARRLPEVCVENADALRHRLDGPVVVGNIPFHVTTPIMRRLLERPAWSTAVLLTQWEVARKRAGVGGATMMTAQAAPWFRFQLETRVPATAFAPMPSVDAGLLVIERRPTPLVPPRQRREYERFVRAVFTGRGRGLAQIVGRAAGLGQRRAHRTIAAAGIRDRSLPRDLSPQQWARLWTEVGCASLHEGA
ncbi:23S ribosomal RNA methyltransferase Erm [Tomitella fengzijianii]|uniref:23S ribosomal RNA methyltransferase Erm n=1 Tax=Tomitella fengzijianii TaxID=2597660 RepID=A0A516X217_9ACTN|nr:23S ribosomal RNA methyltransferase Erm [Tomitella fengzijianii]QDQ97119.1 23S ribosomal RNA methyltransferase Erm [Tomitella fengzijianii]